MVPAPRVAQKLECSPRPAVPEDLDQLVSLEARGQIAPWTAQQWRDEFKSPLSQILVFTDDETDEQVLAYIVIRTLSPDVEILNLLVDRPYRRIGLAGRLIEWARREAIGAKATRLVLDVRTENTGAVALYQKHGFTIRGLRKGFYSNGNDAYTMEAVLTDGNTVNRDLDRPARGTS